jgi:hypothetical protein
LLNDISAEDILLRKVNEKVIRCKLCPRLIKYIKEVGKTKAKMFFDQPFWAKPVPLSGILKRNYWL